MQTVMTYSATETETDTNKKNIVLDKMTIERFESYKLVSFNSDEKYDTPESKVEQEKIKDFLLTYGTEMLTLHVFCTPKQKDGTFYKLINNEIIFKVCKDNNIPFRLKAFEFEDKNENEEAINKYILDAKILFPQIIIEELIDNSILTIEETVEETETIEKKERVTKEQKYTKLRNESTNDDAKFFFNFILTHGISYTEALLILLQKDYYQIDNDTFCLTSEQKRLGEKRVTEILKIKGKYITGKTHPFRNYIKMFCKLKESQYEPFTKFIIREATLRPFPEKEHQLQARLNEVGEFFEVSLGLKTNTKEKIEAEKLTVS